MKCYEVPELQLLPLAGRDVIATSLLEEEEGYGGRIPF